MDKDSNLQSQHLCEAKLSYYFRVEVVLSWATKLAVNIRLHN